MQPYDKPQDLTNDQQVLSKPRYNSPRILEAGDVQELTHGSREQTSDSGSGYYGG